MHKKVAGRNWQDSICTLESKVLRLFTLIVPQSLSFHTSISQGTFRPSVSTRIKSTSKEMKCIC